jgi:hypothetical protein
MMWSLIAKTKMSVKISSLGCGARVWRLDEDVAGLRNHRALAPRLDDVFLLNRLFAFGILVVHPLRCRLHQQAILSDEADLAASNGVGGTRYPSHTLFTFAIK